MNKTLLTQAVILKPGKEKALKNRHQWIFSGAISRLPQFEDGDFLPIYSATHEYLATGYFNRKSSIIGRVITFERLEPISAIRKYLEQAIALRHTLFNQSETNCFRLVNGEGDNLPGLIIDRYDSVLAIQLTTLAMDKLRPHIIDILRELCQPTCIYEKSSLPSRKEEGLTDAIGVLYGACQEEIEVLEHGLKFHVSLSKGQKTGFFLDHREMRQQIRRLSQNRRVLNCFCYTGGFSVYAAAGQAKEVVSVDISQSAMEMARKNMQVNGFDQRASYHTADVFKYLREADWQADLVILDPPAFAKKRKDIIPACRGYKDLNRIALQKIQPKSLLLTCSCSHHVDAELFKKVVFQAAVEANRNVRIVGKHQLAADHPINICHPESDYLKSLLLYIE